MSNRFESMANRLHTLETKKKAGLALFLVAAGLAVAWGALSWSATSTPLFPRWSPLDEDRAAALDARLDAIERRQSEQFNEISRQLAALSSRDGRRFASPEQLRKKDELREHIQRMRDDTAYARKVQEQRLAALQEQFANEPVNQRWSTESRTLTGEALASAVAQAGVKVGRTEVDCRSSSCRIAFTVGTNYAYDDVLTYLMTDLAELLPGAELVIMPPDNGIREVNIFARKATPTARPLQGG